MNITDNYLEKELYDALCTLHIEYNSVHWLGYHANPQHALHELMIRTKPKQLHTGATTWYNIRPIDPQWHNDIDSYCTRKGNTYIPKNPPTLTHLYYLKSPIEGGELELKSGELVKPYVNRHVSFDCNITHRVRPYKGNRVSIGIIWWNDTPIYGTLPRNSSRTLHRQWEIEDAETDAEN